MIVHLLCLVIRKSTATYLHCLAENFNSRNDIQVNNRIFLCVAKNLSVNPQIVQSSQKITHA